MARANLFVIGINKAGTSWLYYLLDKHPDIYMSDVKELFFFGTEQEGPTDLDTYHRHFEFNGAYSYYGEASPLYYQDPTVASDIKSYNPDAKLLAIVRDPIQRARSQFQYHKQLGIVEEGATLDDVLSTRPRSYLANSHYEETLPAFEEQFGPNQFKIVSLEEGKTDPETFWTDLLSFLDLPTVPCPDPQAEPENPTGSPSFRWIYRTTIKPIKQHAPALYQWMLQSTVVRQVKLGLLRILGHAEEEPMSPHVQNKLRKEFAPTYEYLADLGLESYKPD